MTCQNIFRTIEADQFENLAKFLVFNLQNERFFMCSSEKESEPVTLVRPQKAASFTPSQRVSQTRGIYIWSQPSVAQSGVPYTYFQTVLNCFTNVLPPTHLVHSERTELCLDCTTQVHSVVHTANSTYCSDIFNCTNNTLP